MPYYHYAPQEFLAPRLPISVHLAGVGGTGSMMLTELGRINSVLQSMGHAGLHVMAYDADTVSEANLGRQLFAEADLGRNKATVMVERVNRFYGFGWGSIANEYLVPDSIPDILITCVDKGEVRKQIVHSLKRRTSKTKPCYWLDCGNRKNDGQAVLGTLHLSKEPSRKKKAEREIMYSLPTILDLFDDYGNDPEEEQGPSCSVAQAVSRQNLFVNRAVCTFAADLLWTLFYEARLSVHGCFINMVTKRTNPLAVKPRVQ